MKKIFIEYFLSILILLFLGMQSCEQIQTLDPEEEIIDPIDPIDTTNTSLRLVPQQYTTIQSAIISANKYDTVLVSPGTYYENINFIGKNIVVKSSGSAESTIIDGSQPSDPNNSSVVKFVTSEDSITATLDGFTITCGSGSWSWAGKVGGGIWIENAQAVIKDCIIKNNSAVKGGGLSCGYDNAHQYLNSCVLINCVITNNTSQYDGSGIYVNFYASIDIDHCTLANNNFSLSNTATAALSLISNTIIWFGTTNIVYDGPYEFNYCDIQGGWSTGVGNMDSDPIFCNSLLGNFQVASNSPCIGAGENGSTIGALGSCGLQYSRFDYPLEIGTSWKYSYSYNYSHFGEWFYRKGIHYWTVVDSSVFNNEFIRFTIKSVNDDTTANNNNPTPQHIIDSTFFYVDKGPDIVIVRPPSYGGGIQDNIQGFYSGNDSIQIGGRTYKEKVGLARMYHENMTNTHTKEIQQLLDFNVNLK